MRVRTTVAALFVAAAAIVGLAAPASARTGTQHFLLLQTAADGPTSVSANGPIHAAGRDVVLSDTRDRFVFAKGKLIVDHHPQSSHDSFDPVTCLGRFTETGTYTIVRGTDAYQGVTGHGTYTAKGYFRGCNPNRPPAQVSVVINASGPITLP